MAIDKIIDDLILNRVSDLQEIVQEMGKHMKNKTISAIENNITRLRSQDPRDAKFIKEKRNDIKLFLYNNRDMVIKTHEKLFGKTSIII